MWFYIPEWLKFWNKQAAEDRKFSELIKKRAEEQNAVIDKAKAEAATPQRPRISRNQAESASSASRITPQGGPKGSENVVGAAISPIIPPSANTKEAKAAPA